MNDTLFGLDAPLKAQALFLSLMNVWWESIAS